MCVTQSSFLYIQYDCNILIFCNLDQLKYNDYKLFLWSWFCLFLSCMCSVCSPSAVSCVVSEWTQWSGCAEPCRATVRRRSRTVLQEPLNAGKPCPHLEEHAGCAEYWTHHGHCHNSLGEKKKTTWILPCVPVTATIFSDILK